MSLNLEVFGFEVYNRTFIQGFAIKAKCLHAFVGRNSTLNWTSECTKAFELLKTKPYVNVISSLS